MNHLNVESALESRDRMRRDAEKTMTRGGRAPGHRLHGAYSAPPPPGVVSSGMSARQRKLRLREELEDEVARDRERRIWANANHHKNGTVPESFDAPKIVAFAAAEAAPCPNYVPKRVKFMGRDVSKYMSYWLLWSLLGIIGLIMLFQFSRKKSPFKGASGRSRLPSLPETPRVASAMPLDMPDSLMMPSSAGASVSFTTDGGSDSAFLNALFGGS